MRKFVCLFLCLGLLCSFAFGENVEREYFVVKEKRTSWLIPSLALAFFSYEGWRIDNKEYTKGFSDTKAICIGLGVWSLVCFILAITPRKEYYPRSVFPEGRIR